MEQKELGEIMMRKRGGLEEGRSSKVPPAPAAPAPAPEPAAVPADSNVRPRTAISNLENSLPGFSTSFSGTPARQSSDLLRRRQELKKMLLKDQAAAESELAKLNARSELLRDFLLDTDTAAEKIDDLENLINAPKELARQLDQLELRYFKSSGRVSALLGSEKSAAGENTGDELPIPRTLGTLLYEALPLIAGMILSALIIAGAMALIFT